MTPRRTGFHLIWLLGAMVCVIAASCGARGEGDLLMEVVSLSPLPAQPGAFIVHVFEIRNLLNAEVSYGVEVKLPEGWYALDVPSTISIGPGGVYSLFLIISVPAAALPGDEGITVTLFDIEKRDVITEGTAFVRVGEVRDLAITTPKAVDIIGGGSRGFSCKVENRGNVREDLSFEIELPPSAPLALSHGKRVPLSIRLTPEKASLSPSASIEVAVNIVCPPLEESHLITGKFIARDQETGHIKGEVPILFALAASAHLATEPSSQFLIPSLLSFDTFSDGKDSGFSYEVSGHGFLRKADTTAMPGRPQGLDIFYQLSLKSRSIIPFPSRARITSAGLGIETPALGVRLGTGLRSSKLLGASGSGIDVKFYRLVGGDINTCRSFIFNYSPERQYIGGGLSWSPLKGLTTTITGLAGLGRENPVPFGGELDLDLLLPNSKKLTLSIASEERNEGGYNGRRISSSFFYRAKGLSLSLNGNFLMGEGSIITRSPWSERKDPLWQITGRGDLSIGMTKWEGSFNVEMGRDDRARDLLQEGALKASIHLPLGMKVITGASVRSGLDEDGAKVSEGRLSGEINGPLTTSGVKGYWSAGLEGVKRGVLPLAPQIWGHVNLTPLRVSLWDSASVWLGLKKEGGDILLEVKPGLSLNLREGLIGSFNLIMVNHLSSGNPSSLSASASLMGFHSFSDSFNGKGSLTLTLKDGGISWRASLGLSLEFNLPTGIVTAGKVMGRAISIDTTSLSGERGDSKGFKGLRVMVGGFSRETREDGSFEPMSLPVGEHTVKVLNLPAGYLAEFPGTIRVAAGEVQDLTIRVFKVAQVSGEIFIDEDRDGLRDEEEKGGKTIRVLLLSDGGTLVKETFTDKEGHFKFTEVLPGKYLIEIDEEWIPHGYVPGTLQPEPFTITGGQTLFLQYSLEEEKRGIIFSLLPTEARFSWSPERPEKGKPVKFFDESICDLSRRIESYEWSFGDGEMSREQNPTHIYRAPGRYQVTLRVTDDTGKTSEASALLIVK